MILVDTGPLVAVGDRDDAAHARCVTALANAQSPLLVIGPVIAEVCYLLGREVGAAAEARFLRGLAASDSMEVVELENEDLERAADLVEQYADFPLGGTDAMVIAVAERLNITTVATLDLRHFRAVRPRHTDAFTLIP
jgi:predicted nucleic acid-binding protein